MDFSEMSMGMFSWRRGAQRLNVAGASLVGVPGCHLGSDMGLAEQFPNGDAMVPVSHVVDIADLDQVDRWHFNALFPGQVNSLPAVTVVYVQRVEIAIEVLTAAFRAADQGNRNKLVASCMPAMDRASRRHIGKFKKLAW